MLGEPYPFRKLGEVLRHARRPITPQPDQTYDLIGVRWYAAGTHLHGTVDGAKLQAPTLWRAFEGDIIYNKMWTSKGAFAVVSKETSGLFGTSEYPTFEPKSGVSADFLRYSFQQSRFWQLAEAWTNGTTERARLSPRDFLKLSLPCPSLAEQRAIAEVLGSLEEAICKTERLIEAIAQTETALLKQYFVERQKSLTWSRVAKMGRWLSGGTPATAVEENWKGPVPWVCPKDIKGATVSSTIDHISEDAAKALGIVAPGTLLLVVRGMILTRTVPSTICAVSCSFNQDVKAFVPNKDVLPAFLKLWFDINEHKLLGEIETATHGTKRFPLERLNAFPVPKLASEEQIRLVRLAECSQDRLRSERENLSSLHASRDALAQELLSGRVRLPDSIIARHRNKVGQAA